VAWRAFGEIGDIVSVLEAWEAAEVWCGRVMPRVRNVQLIEGRNQCSANRIAEKQRG